MKYLRSSYQCYFETTTLLKWKLAKYVFTKSVNIYWLQLVQTYMYWGSNYCVVIVKVFLQGSMVVLYLAQYQIFENVLITILLSNLLLWPPEFVLLHLVVEYVPNFYPRKFFGFWYQAFYKATPINFYCISNLLIILLQCILITYAPATAFYFSKF